VKCGDVKYSPSQATVALALFSRAARIAGYSRLVGLALVRMQNQAFNPLAF
jgi:hypothetical protein